MNQESQKFEVHLPVEEATTAVELLSVKTEFSKQKIKQIMQNGAVWLTRDESTSRLRRAKRTLTKGDELHLYYDEAVQSAVPGTPDLIADEGDYSVFFKPPGMFSQGSKWGDQCTINRWVEQNMDRPAFVVHRLDRAAAGLILIAHTKTAAAALSKLFELRLVDKCYRACVVGRVEPSSMVLNSDLDGRKAISRMTLLEYDETKNCSLVEVNIETGRKHQIRRHLAEAGYPIIGDRLYGNTDDVKAEDSEDNIQPDLQLVATELSFTDSFSNKEAESRKSEKKNVWASSTRSKSDSDEIDGGEIDSDEITGDKTVRVEIKSYAVPDRLLAPELCKPATDESSDGVWPGRQDT